LPLIHVEILEGRPPEKVKKMIEKITDAVEEALEAPRPSIRVIVTEIPKTHWAVGGVPIADNPDRR